MTTVNKHHATKTENAADAFRRNFLARLGHDSALRNERGETEAALDRIAEDLERVVDVERLLAITRVTSPPTP